MRISHFAIASLALQTQRADALIEPNKTSTVAENEFVHPDLNITATTFTSDPTDTAVAARVARLESRFNLTSGSTLVDDRSGRVTNLFASSPIIPGTGIGNSLAPQNYPNSPSGSPTMPPIEIVPDEDYLESAILAVQSWLTENEGNLDVDVSELFAPGTVRSAIHGGNGDLIQLHIPRFFNGVRVFGSRATATIKRGNLISIGFESWGTIEST